MAFLCLHIRVEPDLPVFVNVAHVVSFTPVPDDAHNSTYINVNGHVRAVVETIDNILIQLDNAGVFA